MYQGMRYNRDALVSATSPNGRYEVLLAEGLGFMCDNFPVWTDIIVEEKKFLARLFFYFPSIRNLIGARRERNIYTSASSSVDGELFRRSFKNPILEIDNETATIYFDLVPWSDKFSIKKKKERYRLSDLEILEESETEPQ